MSDKRKTQVPEKVKLSSEKVIDNLKKNASNKIHSYKKTCESNIIACIYKTPDIIYDIGITEDDFDQNHFKVYFIIARDLIIKEKKKELDDITIGLYLEKHKKLSAVWDEHDGYNTIEMIRDCVNDTNIDSYVYELRKWQAVLKLIELGFPVWGDIKKFNDMSLEEIYDEYDALLNHIFTNIDSEEKSSSMSEGIYELIDELDEGCAVGLPYKDMPYLTKLVGGMLNGNITLVGGLSNIGKTTLARNMIIPSCIDHGERLVIILNEEGKKKWQRELLVWVANNIYHKDIQKYAVRDGKYSKEFKDILRECADWIVKADKDKQIIFYPFNRYKTAKAIKVIKKYASLGVKHFILDTYKMDAGTKSQQMWQDMQQNMVDIYDAIKTDGGKDVHITITFQLAKSSSRQRFYSQDNIGLAKNIVDVASTCLMVRNMFDDEKHGGSHELEVFNYDLNNKTKMESKYKIQTQKEKHYQIIFPVKNREGSANDLQIVCEHDMSKNILKEIGYTRVPMDF